MLDEKSGDPLVSTSVVSTRRLDGRSRPGLVLRASRCRSSSCPRRRAPLRGGLLRRRPLPWCTSRRRFAQARAPADPLAPRWPAWRWALPAQPLLGANTLSVRPWTVADVQRDHPALGLAGAGQTALGEGVQVELVPDTPGNPRQLGQGPRGAGSGGRGDPRARAHLRSFSTNWPLDSAGAFLADSLTYLAT